jgi:hypothetical protein
MFPLLKQRLLCFENKLKFKRIRFIFLNFVDKAAPAGSNVRDISRVRLMMMGKTGR